MTAPHATPYAGTWFPGDPAELTKSIEQHFWSSEHRTGPAVLPGPLAFVVPHAGMSYSGTVAAAAYRHLQAAQPPRVFLLGFCHRGGRPGVALPDLAAYSSPLGETLVDRDALLALAAREPFHLVPESRVCDHSVEIQLPFLQKAAPDAVLVPLYAGHLDDDARRRAAAALAGHIRPGDVLIASSDFTHYGASFQHLPFPADYDLVPRLHELDEGYLEAAGSLSPSLFLAALREKEATVCGHAPVALLLETLQQLGAEDIFQQTLDYQTSAEITGDRDHSVSYAALGYFHAGSFYLDEADQRTLLDCARATLRHLSREGGRRAVPPETAGPALQRRAGAFVSLHHGEQLFGCIGMRAARQPLAQMIPELTLSAALDDPRFHHHGAIPADLQLEISILTPSKRIPDPGLFRLGRDGATLETGGRAGLLLPQVAGGTINSETRFLEALSRKTGCAPDAYRDPEARLSVFRAQVFS